MTAVTTVGLAGQVFDPWLWSLKWNVSTLTYSFPADGSHISYQSTGDVTTLTASQKSAVRSVLDEIAGFTGLEFVEVTESSSTEGDLRFAKESGLGGAYAYLPTSSTHGGDAFFGSGSSGPELGNEAYIFFLHEIGHAMGLEHGHEFPAFVASGLNSQEYTVVTYTDFVGDSATFSYDSGPVDWAQSFQQLDIAALQFLYGANYAGSGELWSGDTVYRFDPDTGEMSINGVGQGVPVGNRIFRTIWDGDGEDTYDLHGYTTDMVIDLSPGGFSTFSEDQLADLDRFSISDDRMARGNVANARLVDGDARGLIENARGGAGNDIIFGNQADNVLTGRAGDDSLFGGNGNDDLWGGTGNDTLRGGQGNDKLRGQHDNDTLIGGDGNDLLVGGSGVDLLIGDAGYDRMRGKGGADVFRFRSATDSVTGDRIDRVLDFTSGEDVIDLSRINGPALELALGGKLAGGGAGSVATRERGDNTMVLVDADGDGTAEMRFFLMDSLGVRTGDFLL